MGLEKYRKKCKEPKEPSDGKSNELDYVNVEVIVAEERKAQTGCVRKEDFILNPRLQEKEGNG